MLTFLSKRELTFLEKQYVENTVPAMKEKFNIKNPHEIPHIKKVGVSMRFGKDAGDKKAIESAINELSLITGRKPAQSKAKKSISGFKLREGQISGAYCTLRGKSAFLFLERQIYLSIPRIRDFRGFSKKSFDSSFNFNFGIQDHLIFPELNYDSIHKSRGLDVTIVIGGKKTKENVTFMLQNLNFPVR